MKSLDTYIFHKLGALWLLERIGIVLVIDIYIRGGSDAGTHVNGFVIEVGTNHRGNQGHQRNPLQLGIVHGVLVDAVAFLEGAQHLEKVVYALADEAVQVSGHRGVDAAEEYGRPTTVLSRHGHHILPSATHLVHQIRTAR